MSGGSASGATVRVFPRFLYQSGWSTVVYDGTLAFRNDTVAVTAQDSGDLSQTWQVEILRRNRPPQASPPHLHGKTTVTLTPGGIVRGPVVMRIPHIWDPDGDAVYVEGYGLPPVYASNLSLFLGSLVMMYWPDAADVYCRAVRDRDVLVEEFTLTLRDACGARTRLQGGHYITFSRSEVAGGGRRDKKASSFRMAARLRVSGVGEALPVSPEFRHKRVGSTWPVAVLRRNAARAKEGEMGAGRGRRVGWAVGWVCLLVVLCWGQGRQAPEWFSWFVDHPSSPMVLPIGQPGQLLVDDFNGDGNLDLIIKTYRGPFIWELGPDYGLAEVNIVMLLGDGQGGFGPPTTLLATKGSFVAHLVVDVNGDGHLDLVVVRRHITAEYAKSEIQGMFGDGRGGLAPPQTLFEIDDIPRHIAVADLNGNGHLDFVLAHLMEEVVSVFLADGQGGFVHHENILLEPDYLPGQVVLADFNNGGYLDLAIAGEIYEAHDRRTRFVAAFLGDGEGGFPRRSFFMTFDPPEARVPWINLIALDYDYDGNVDLITSRQDEILLLLGNGDGTFTLDDDFWLPASDLNPRIDAVVHFNQDGCWDWVISSNSPPWFGLDLIIMSCGPSAGGALGWASRLFVSGAVAADVDGDGDLDVVYVSGVVDRDGNELTLLEWVINNITNGAGQ